MQRDKVYLEEAFQDLTPLSDLLEDMKCTLILKSADYAKATDNLSNFKFSGYILDEAVSQG